MPKYEFDALRWCRTMAKAHWQRNEHDISSTFRTVAEEIDNLRAELDALKSATIYVYNSGYHAGHHDTVEGRYVDIHPCDMDTYHAEDVIELVSALGDK